MPLFQRPHRCACDMYVEINVDLAEMRQLSSYEEWLAKLQEELKAVYEVPRSITSVQYSTTTSPTVFSSEVNEKIFGMLKTRDDNSSAIVTLSETYEEMVEARQQVEAERDPEKKMTRKERKLDQEERAKLKLMQREIVNKEYERDCLSLKLKNFETIQTVRVNTSLCASG